MFFIGVIVGVLGSWVASGLLAAFLCLPSVRRERWKRRALKPDGAVTAEQARAYQHWIQGR